MNAIEAIVLVIVIIIAMVAVAGVVWWRFYRGREKESEEAPAQPLSLFDVRISDLEARLELVKVTIRSLHL